MKPNWLQFDTRDDQDEIMRLLKRLPPRKRVSFVQQCCNKFCKDSPLKVRVQRQTHELAERARMDDSADSRLSHELFMDLWHLAAQWGADENMDDILEALVHEVLFLHSKSAIP
jgi:DNA-directed RNA polymerase specialized sigma24 family protein